jgi:hypothetical protein
MRIAFSTLFLAALCCCAGVCTAADVEKDFQPLSGNGLGDWQEPIDVPGEWRAVGGVIQCVGRRQSWLCSRETYSDFTLRLEYKLELGGNSGVSVRAPDPARGDPEHEGLEIQLLDDRASKYRELHPTQYTGSIYYQAAPRTRAELKSGEWNALEIRCENSEVIVSVNGVEIARYNLARYKEARAGYTPLNKRARSGFIALESHTGQAEFRNIRIKAN